MGRVKDREFWESANYNNASFMIYYNRLLEMALSRFEWAGLPDTVDARYLELCLFGTGRAIFFEDEYMGLVVARGNQAGGFDIYGNPDKRTAIGYNGYYKDGLDRDNSVIAYNNYLWQPSVLEAEYYAKRLWDLDRSVDVNAKAQKTPVLVRCREGQRLSLKNAYLKFDGNAPVIFADEKFDMDGITVLKTDAPFVADKLYELRNMIWSEALTWLGISNTNIQKKERLVTDEVIRNQGGVIAARHSPLEMRRMACDKVNAMFGTDISCDFRPDFREIGDESIQNDETMDGDRRVVTPEPKEA